MPASRVIQFIYVLKEKNKTKTTLISETELTISLADLVF